MSIIDESLKPSDQFETFLHNVKCYLCNPDLDYLKLTNYNLTQWDRYIYLSRTTNINETQFEDGSINLFQQFYINKIDERQNEIKKTLLYNCNNNKIDNIFLLNERIYTEEELGVKSSKIKQIVINKRLTYNDIFTYVNENNINGYIVISNSDIFFDKTISNIKNCELIKNKKIYCLNRYNFSNNNLSTLDLDLIGRPDCQDVWIYHSDFNNLLYNKNIFDIQLGTPGCDNKIIYLFKLLGFKCYNEPEIIKTYHYHKILTRNYNNNTERPAYPYYGIFPALKDDYNNNNRNIMNYMSFDINEENQKIFDYIQDNINNNKTFIIPQITIPDTNLAMAGVMLINKSNITNLDNLNKQLKLMSNRYININDDNSIEEIKKFSTLFLESFERCKTYMKWEPWGKEYNNTSNSHYFIENNFKKNMNLWAEAFNLFYNIHNNPWTFSLKGKNILIISHFNNLIREKINIRDKIYNIDLFPDCNFVFLDIHEDYTKLSYKKLLINLINDIENISDSFDIALISCRGLSNILISYIDDLNKSAIVANNFLESSFGIYDEVFEKEHSDIIKLYKNEYWTKI